MPAAAGAALGLASVGPALGLTAGVASFVATAAAAFVLIQAVWSLRVEGKRHSVDRVMQSAIWAACAIAIIPLAAILGTVILRGMRSISATFATGTMRSVSPQLEGGGLLHALIGTVEQVLLASVVCVPIGVLVAVYLVEFGRGPLATAVSYAVDVLTGLPSIVAGLFVYASLILAFGMQRSGLAASIALSILMLPMVVRTTEEMLRLVSHDLREAALALGLRERVMITRVVIPAAVPGIITGAMLAVARAAGETAPILLTTFLAQGINWNPVAGPQAALPTFIWDQISAGTDAAVDRAWGGALVLITVIAATYLVARAVARLFAPGGRRRRSTAVSRRLGRLDREHVKAN